MPTALDSFLAAPVQALQARNYRAEVLASNIANADTPHYKARDFDFPRALHEAMAARAPAGLMKTSLRHLDAVGGKPIATALQYRIPVQASIDANTVELDTELAQFSDNALHMQADLTFLGNRFRMLQIAISGQ